jgi:flagellum-specific ATP synthase
MLHPVSPLQAHGQVWGTVTDVAPGMLKIAGVSRFAGVGNGVRLHTRGAVITGEVLTVSSDRVTTLLFTPCDTVRIGDRADITASVSVSPGDHWLGQIINFQGEVQSAPSCVNACAASSRAEPSRPVQAAAPPPGLRRPLGPRLATGWMVFDTLLPICRGQRIGLFAGSGVGKSSLIAALARGIAADRIVIALIGERSREVNAFAADTLDAATRAKTVIVAATANEPPGAKKRAALCAVTAAEHFRDAGHNVLFLFDSITRFAEAHREIALMAGETPALNAFPPSTVRVISDLAERTGPGTATTGDITAIFSVLVAGSDLEEPVADMIRGVLDGHVVLSRAIAERGRYPAIDVGRSVSRCLPQAASAAENALLLAYRRNLALYQEVSPMLRASLYEFGQDAETDRAIALYPVLDAFISTPSDGGTDGAFAALDQILNPAG